MQWLELLRQFLPMNADPFCEQRYLEERLERKGDMVWEGSQFRFGGLGKGVGSESNSALGNFRGLWECSKTYYINS